MRKTINAVHRVIKQSSCNSLVQSISNITFNSEVLIRFSNIVNLSQKLFFY
uniref:Uncharacterized protein n=1 Tax=Arundo donax TaxID=35708 RepID=A0A0A9EZQ6_ARUDO